MKIFDTTVSIKEILNRIRLPAYEYFADPVNIRKEDYSSALDRIIETTGNYAGVSSIYLVNQEKFNEICNFELIYVLDDQFDLNLIESQLLPVISSVLAGKESQITYVPFFFNINTFRYLYYLIPDISITPLTSRPITPYTLPEDEMRNYRLIYLIDRVIVAPFPFLISSVLRGCFAVCASLNWLLQTKSLLNTFVETVEPRELREEKQQFYEEYITFSKEIKYLCDEWFNLGLERYQILKQLVFQAIELLIEFIDFLSEELIKERIVFPGIASHKTKQAELSSAEFQLLGTFLKDDLKINFITNWTPQLALEQMIQFYQDIISKNLQSEENILYLPATFLVQLIQYSKEAGYFSERINERLLIYEWAGSAGMPHIMNFRARLINQYVSHLINYPNLIRTDLTLIQQSPIVRHWWQFLPWSSRRSKQGETATRNV